MRQRYLGTHTQTQTHTRSLSPTTHEYEGHEQGRLQSLDDLRYNASTAETRIVH